MNTTNVMNLLQVIVLGILAYGIPYVLKELNAYIDKKQQEIVKNSYLNEAIDLIQTVVNAVSQTYVFDLKKAEKFDKEAQTEALNQAVSTARAMLNSELTTWIETTYNDLETWIKTQIESYINTIK